ncbi:hypothetical protein [Deinococcus aquaticus]|uniref:hypothetical protein n=1 Tax=Deinococcus aquaticus TaxID=328692 RepID=UPI003F474ECC
MVEQKRVIIVDGDTLDMQFGSTQFISASSVDLTEPARTVVFPEVRPTRQARRAAERQQRKRKGAGVG